MPSYEVGIELNKLIRKILSEMAIRDRFDRLVVDRASEQTDTDTIVSLFRSYLRIREEK